MPRFRAVVNVVVVGPGENPQIIDVSETWEGDADDFAEAAQVAIEHIPDVDGSVIRKYGDI